MLASGQIDLLTKVHHKNLVTLVSYCNDGNNLMLMYEYMPLGSLQDHLYGTLCCFLRDVEHFEFQQSLS